MTTLLLPRIHLHVSSLPPRVCLILSPTQTCSHSEPYNSRKKKARDWGKTCLVSSSAPLYILFLSLHFHCFTLFAAHHFPPCEERFLWSNAALDRLGACWKPQIPVLSWIWSLLRYRLIPPCALTTSAKHLQPTCSDVIAFRWVASTSLGGKKPSPLLSFSKTSCILHALCPLVRSHGRMG